MINSERELLDMAIALREENRALKALIREVVNEIKMTVAFPVTAERALKGAYDVVLQKQTLLKLLDLGGDDVGRGPRETERGTGIKEETSQTKNAIRERK